MKLDAERPNQLWGIDMTYIWCRTDGWAYLHAVIDHFDRPYWDITFPCPVRPWVQCWLSQRPLAADKY